MEELTLDPARPDLPEAVAYADGSVYPNPGGPGGWGVVLLLGDRVDRLCGGEPSTTNNRMELRAVIEALRALISPHRVTIYTDSEVTQRCICGVYRRAANLDLWREFGEAARPHEVEAIHVRGHRDLWKVPEAERTSARLQAEADNLAAQGRLLSANGLMVRFHYHTRSGVCPCGRAEEARLAEGQERYCGHCPCGILHVGRKFTDLHLGGVAIQRV